MYAVRPSLIAIRDTMKAAPVTFVGASVFIVLNITDPYSSDVKIIDPDHPILFNTGALNVPGGVMAANKMHGQRDWEDFKAKWEWNFRSGMTNFFDWWDAKASEALPQLR
jgi:hypothetical protein